MPSRGALAALLCGIALVALGLAFVLPDRQAAQQLVVVAVPILWVCGVVALTPFGDVRGRTATLATLVSAGAFLLPAATATSATGVVWGFQAFTLGITVVPVAWAANILFVAALELRRRSGDRRASRVAVLAFLLALTAPLTLTPNLAVSVGFVAWAAAPAILAIAALRSPRR